MNHIQPLTITVVNKLTPKVTEVVVMVIIHIFPNFLERIKRLIGSCVATEHKVLC